MVKQLGKYRVLEKIGAGGFGEVFKGHDPFIKRSVAIKTCTADDEETRTRFFNEAEIAGNLHHRNITTVYDFGVQDDLPYLIQEYLSGEDLDRKIKRKEFLPYAEKLYYLLQIARGLAYAHTQGVIHRDIKPANVRILEDGTAKIMDFGIAKLAQEETGLTQTGMTLGTAAYLAPEQIKGENVDHRTDVFSYGVLAYELLALERPFQGQQISAVLYEILHSNPPPITEYWPKAPEPIIRVLGRCLAKDPSDRYADAGELLRDLERLQKQGRARREQQLESGDVLVTPPPAKPKPVGTPGSPTSLAGPHRPQTLEDMELAVTPTGGLPRPETTIAVQAKPGLSRLTLAAIVVLLLATAGAVGWWVGTRGPTTSDPDSQQASTTEAEAPADPEDAAEETEPPPEATPPPPSPETGGSGTNLTTTDVTPRPQPGPPSPAVEAAPPPPPPPAPRPGILVVQPPGWTDSIAVVVDGERRPLIRSWDIPLPAGRHTVRFEISLPGYSLQRSLQVDLAPGTRRTVSSPIPRPAALSVRPLPGRPQGQVWLDADLVGPTPIRRKLRIPGSHRLEIRPQGPGESLVQNIRLVAGQETVVSFDLRAGAIQVTEKAFSVSP